MSSDKGMPLPEMTRLIGDTGRERDCVGARNGFVRSKGPVDDLDFPVPRFFDGEVEIDTPFIPDISEGVSGVFVSERALFLVGVFGVLITGNEFMK